MRLKNWLLMGTSIGFIALAPLSANAQDAGLQAAYKALLEAQASGDTAAVEAAQNSFTELCIVGGYASLEECIAALNATQAPAEPAAEAAPAPAVEPEPVAEPEPVVEEPAAEPEPAMEEPASEQPAVEPEPAPEAAPAAEPEAAVQAEPEVQPEPVAEEAPAAPEAAPMSEPAAEEVAPVEEPAAEEAAPVEPVAEEPAAAVEAEADYAGLLAAQVAIYDEAIAEIMAGGDAAAIGPRLNGAREEIAAICAEAGQPDVTACLAQYNLVLTPMPEQEQPAAPAQEPAAVEETTPDGQPAEMIETLPEGVKQEQIAPVLDSAKDEQTAPPAEGTTEPQAQVEAAPAEAAPASDQDAQAAFEPQDAARVSAFADEGQSVEAAAVQQAVPQNVTIINQTNIIDNSVTNIGQQNNVTTIEQQNNVQANMVRPASPGEAITQVILQIGTQLIVNSVGQDTDRFYDPQQDEIYYENLSNGRVREVITRPDGSQIVTVRNRNGDILRRSRITPDGREYVLASFNDRYDNDLNEWRDPGANLPPLRLNIPVRDYVLDSRYADENELEVFFGQPPVERVARLYSIDEVKRSSRVRDSVRKLEVGNLTFDSGAASIPSDQVRSLSSVANAMLTLLDRNPGETFLIEGHTDAVGSDISNLGLSDLRAATVARILSDFYGVPPENLATQGYGERYLKIRTEAAERENRRVTIRRITPLITTAQN